MPLQVDWTGVFPAVPTQFHEDFSLNLPGTQEHIEALIREGVHGLIMLGTIGENCSLSLDEKVRVLEAAVEVADGRL
ncbi:MAG: dihydrodipicolinate synthase family protein, partial [Verrucomicrobiota bacterium]|nr:dihydrodipicolinate synthase family protein [Verrucomicrobiota bacterium]